MDDITQTIICTIGEWTVASGHAVSKFRFIERFILY